MLSLKSLDTPSGGTAAERENGHCDRNHGGDIPKYVIGDVYEYNKMYQKLSLKTAMPSRRCRNTEPSTLRMRDAEDHWIDQDIRRLDQDTSDRPICVG